MNAIDQWKFLSDEFVRKMNERDFTPIDNDQTKDTEKTFTGELSDAPLIRHPIFTIGINPATGSGEYYKWKRTPVTVEEGCGLGDPDRSGPNYGGRILRLVSRALEIQEQTALQTLKKKSFYTNRLLVRTPNTRTFAKKLNDSSEISAWALRQMLQTVRPNIILCFGVGNDVRNSPSAFVLQELSKIDNWKSTGHTPFPIRHGKRTLTARYFAGISLQVDDNSAERIFSDVWSFPHPAYLSGDPWLNNKEMLKALGKSLSSALGR